MKIDQSEFVQINFKLPKKVRDEFKIACDSHNGGISSELRNLVSGFLKGFRVEAYGMVQKLIKNEIDKLNHQNSEEALQEIEHLKEIHKMVDGRPDLEFLAREEFIKRKIQHRITHTWAPHYQFVGKKILDEALNWDFENENPKAYRAYLTLQSMFLEIDPVIEKLEKERQDYFRMAKEQESEEEILESDTSGDGGGGFGLKPTPTKGPSIG